MVESESGPVTIDPFLTDEDDKQKSQRLGKLILNNQAASDSYDIDDRFRPGNTGDAFSVHTVPELVKHLQENKDTQIDARLMAYSKRENRYSVVKANREAFLKSWERNDTRLREGQDLFGMDGDGSGGGLVGNDFVPLLGGPFNKQLYYYDYLRMHALSFQAYHHDPLARRIVSIMRDFTLGRGFKVDCENRKALALWNAMAEVNDLYQLMDQAAIEISMYGEIMLWELPNNQTKIVYDLRPGQDPAKGLLPRFRLIDPSVIWEIVTYPEDITRVLYYQWVAPTQYQTYTSGNVPSTKFIFQQIPANQVMHFKINCVSNEKRGRSDLFPILGYLKRLRDSIQYEIIARQKAAAWSIDTTISGSQTDIDNYVSDVVNQQFAQAGSEFVHTEKIKREYLANQARGGGDTSAVEGCINMIAAGSGIPVSYMGVTFGHQSTRAGALVATEPVAKLFEMRQWQLERVIRKLWDRVILPVYPDAECEVTFPEIIVQDRSQKLKDLAMSEMNGWVAKSTAASIAGKELQITSYDYDVEKTLIDKEGGIPQLSDGGPLTTPGMLAPTTESPDQAPRKPAAVTQDERKAVKDNVGFA